MRKTAIPKPKIRTVNIVARSVIVQEDTQTVTVYHVFQPTAATIRAVRAWAEGNDPWARVTLTDGPSTDRAKFIRNGLVKFVRSTYDARTDHLLIVAV